MTMPHSVDRPADRSGLALLLAPVAIFPLMLAMHVVATNIRYGLGWAQAGADALESGLFYLLFGVPIAFVAEFAVVGLTRLAGRNEATLPTNSVLAAAMLAGALVNLGIWPMEGLSDALQIMVAGAVMGAAAALVFVAVRGPRGGRA